jgi:hypothetical protein
MVAEDNLYSNDSALRTSMVSFESGALKPRRLSCALAQILYIYQYLAINPKPDI